MIDLARNFVGGPSLRFTMTMGATGLTVLFGPSGSGKTTLLRMLAGLEQPDQGRLVFGGDTWFDQDHGIDVPTQKRRVGYVTQEPALFPHLTVWGNVAFGVVRAERDLRVSEILALLGLTALADRRPHELSGGQKQRVSLARAVAARPRVLLLDEPLSALDTPSREELRRDLGRFLRTIEMKTILVTHDRSEALSLGDDVALIHEGRVVQQGPIAEVFSRPASVEAARVVGIEAVVPARITARTDEGLVTLNAGGVILTALDPGPQVETVFACIRADEVILEPGAAPGSARNRLSAQVRGVHPAGALVRVDLDCGFSLAAYITRTALRELALAEGSRVWAVIKAPAVHLVPRPGP